MDLRKHDNIDFEKEANKVNSDLEHIRSEVENHGNHFAMVENFVEKYIPVRI